MDEVFYDRDYFDKLNLIGTDEEGLKELLEKVAILSFIFDREAVEFASRGVNPFRNMFQGRFEDFRDSDVTNAFIKLYLVYAEDAKKKMIEATEKERTDSFITRPFLKTCVRINRQRRARQARK